MMCYWEDEIDWLTGEYTGKRERLKRKARRLGLVIGEVI
jgi:hypothetical protein